MATCKLCGRVGKGNAKGHIIPAWAYELTSKLDEKFQIGSKEAGYDSPHILEETNRSKLRITEPMFCEKIGEGCDQLIGKGEEEIKNVFIDSSPNSFKTIQGEFPYKIIKPTNYELITRGIAGILLKCYISNKFDVAASLNKSNESLITLLKGAVVDDAISSRIIKIAVIKACTDIDVYGAGKQTAAYLQIHPLPGEKIFILIFGGLVFIVFVDELSHDKDDEIPVFAEHITFAYTHSFVSEASARYTEKYPANDEEIFAMDASKVFKSANYFKELVNPESYSSLTKEWLKKNSTSIRCFCGNLTKNKRARLRDSCCEKFWNQ